MTVPQVGQRPLMARRPFFITSSTASAISFFDLHLTQYPSGIGLLPCGAKQAPDEQNKSVGARPLDRQRQNGHVGHLSRGVVKEKLLTGVNISTC